MALVASCVVGNLLGAKQALNLYFSKVEGLLRSQQISRDRKVLKVSPLMLAVMNGDKEIVRMLVDHPGVILLARDDCCDTAYFMSSIPSLIL